MTRLSMLPSEQWDADLRVLAQAEAATPLEQGLLRIMAHAPELAKALVTFGSTMWRSHTLPRRLLELVRLRIAFHNQCRSCMAIRYQSAVDDGLTEGMVCSLEKPHEAPDLTDAEKAAIAYADLSANDHLSINDETFSQLRGYYTEGEIVELGMFIAFFIGYGRLGAAWDMVEELPQSFQDKSAKAAPWARESIQVRG
ncbi:carboxymuconolactone decarboxylase family protein [Aromatoleum diolicum]|uniref:Carboxymuconolactone decarboxylase family protein n=1 Tax=Aromatoleum diolicum TaxID=75796 RepID=A0ABX1Q5M4_9RHOO|nr:carboxymuconolactone decarboxylase family protein [Aromatoleum diolicum]